MKRTLFIFPVLLVLSLFFIRSADAGSDKVLRVSDGKVITFEQMMEDLRTVSVVFVGELHDSPEHHHAQLSIIDAFHTVAKPVAIGLEMFRTDSQRALDAWVSGKMPLDQFIPIYYENWRIAWPLYRDIFLYARDHELPVQGLNIPEAISKKIARQGFASLTAEERKKLPPDISCNVDPTYMAFIKQAYRQHSSHSGKEFVNFCEAQMVWDKSMAWNLAGYLKKNPDRSMIVLAGIGHAWKRGISEQLQSHAKLSFRVVLPAVPHEIDRESVTVQDADYVLLLQ